MVISIKSDIKVKTAPKLVAILHIELDAATGKPQIDLHAKTIFQIAIEGSNTNPKNADRQAEIQSVGINPALNLTLK